MTEILFAANSQAGCIKTALENNPAALPNTCNVSFFVTPGGTGPYFAIGEDGVLSVTQGDLNHPAHCTPDAARAKSVHDYEMIVVSALGFVDGGFRYDHASALQGRLLEFGPLDEEAYPLISASCLAQAVSDILVEQPGFKFLQNLRATYNGAIIVQPFPYHSSAMIEREDWLLKRRYRDAIGAYQFLADAKDACLMSNCAALGVALLDYPDPAWRIERFTPARLMGVSDLLHPTPEYGAMVLAQIREHL